MLLGPLVDDFGESRDNIQHALRLGVNLGAVRHDVHSVTHGLRVILSVIQRRELIHENDEASGENEVSGSG